MRQDDVNQFTEYRLGLPSQAPEGSDAQSTVQMDVLVESAYDE